MKRFTTNRKQQINFLAVVILFLLFSCNQTSQNQNSGTAKPKADSDNAKDNNLNFTHQNEFYEDVDSLQFDSLLQAVLIIANDGKTKNAFVGEIKLPESENKKLYVKYEFGNLFSSDKKHLLIRRFFEGNSVNVDFYSDIYLFAKNKFITVVSDTADTGYWQDSLFDVNGDNYKDYIISSYSGAGCCPRDEKTAYLYNSKNGKFLLEIFFNPEFDYANKIVYETNYNSPGYLSFYKYKWNGLEKIEVESISPNKCGLDSFIKPYSFIKITYPGEKKQIVRDVPAEYKKLELYEYFISFDE